VTRREKWPPVSSGCAALLIFSLHQCEQPPRRMDLSISLFLYLGGWEYYPHLKL
jgi:hypothetical protein